MTTRLTVVYHSSESRLPNLPFIFLLSVVFPETIQKQLEKNWVLLSLVVI